MKMAAKRAMMEELNRIKLLSEQRAEDILKERRRDDEILIGRRRPATREEKIKRKKRRLLSIVPQTSSITPEINLNQSLSESFNNLSFCAISEEDALNFIENMGLKRVFKRNVKNGNFSNPCESLRTLFPPFVNRITGVLGDGEYGTVFSTRGVNGEKTAVKVMRETFDEDGDPVNREEDVTREMDMGNIFHEFGLAPKILDVDSQRIPTLFGNGRVTIHFISMGRVDGTVKSFLSEGPKSDEEIEELFEKVFDVIIELKNANLNHGDMHIGNLGFIMENGEMKIQLIDYGMSMMREFVELDILQLIRVTHFAHSVDFANRDRVDRVIRRKAKELFGLEYPEYEFVGEGEEDGVTIAKIELIQDGLRDGLS